VKLATLAVAVVAVWGVSAGFQETLLAMSQAVLGIWTPADMAILSSIMSFWFLDRVFRKHQVGY
jgi:hypothetical protein